MGSLYVDANLSREILDCWNHRLLNYLDSKNNKLTGKIPHSLITSILRNSTTLFILDLSENHFNGSVPIWIGDKLSKLMVLRLRSNNFDGHIAHNICDLQSFQTWTLPITTFQDTQLQSFENLAYVGNHLYGALLTKNCTAKSFSTDVTNNGGGNKRSKVLALCQHCYWLCNGIFGCDGSLVFNQNLGVCILSKVGSCWSKVVS
ncbi:hypothetical protein CXB51_029380 [Gossypium anomalum]|uniref:Uncharacterized protein n=1 Tax=Gossypium anomalum TaxID=47600 RepID=A0A8J5XZP0_9ROSI|nr:hypothetical protein CXB51_029380 [Gossypium anomalum]